MRSAHIPIMSAEICKQAHNYGSSIQNGMFCAGIPQNMIDACDGDSGGPMVCEENGKKSFVFMQDFNCKNYHRISHTLWNNLMGSKMWR